jgi:hypothetical protein
MSKHEPVLKIHAAFRAGDLAALDDPAVIPNRPMPLAIGPCLEYAIYHRPLPFIRTMLELGADPNQHGINDWTSLRWPGQGSTSTNRLARWRPQQV